MDGLLPLTELDAVNVMIATGSDSPINTIDDNEIIDASLARNTLRATLVEVQTLGWTFNTDTDIQIKPDQTGVINLPRNTLKVRASGPSAGTNLVQRGVRLYNETDKTFTFETAPTLTIVYGFHYDDLPPIAANYVIIRAARKYQDQYFGDQLVHAYTSQDELQALIALKDWELEVEAPNMLTGSQFMSGLTARR